MWENKDGSKVHLGSWRTWLLFRAKHSHGTRAVMSQTGHGASLAQSRIHPQALPLPWDLCCEDTQLTSPVLDPENHGKARAAWVCPLFWCQAHAWGAEEAPSYPAQGTCHSSEAALQKCHQEALLFAAVIAEQPSETPCHSHFTGGWPLSHCQRHWQCGLSGATHNLFAATLPCHTVSLSPTLAIHITY